MFSPFNANGAATQALRIACQRAAEHEARQHHDAPAAEPVPRAGRRATLSMVLGGWAVALLAHHEHARRRA